MALPLAPVLLLLLLLPLMPPLMLPLPMPLPCLLLALPLLLPRLPLQPTLLPSLLLLLLPLLLLLLTPLLLQQLPPVYIHRCALPGAVLPRPLRRVERTHMCIRPSTLCHPGIIRPPRPSGTRLSGCGPPLFLGVEVFLRMEVVTPPPLPPHPAAPAAVFGHAWFLPPPPQEPSSAPHDPP